MYKYIEDVNYCCADCLISDALKEMKRNKAINYNIVIVCNKELAQKSLGILLRITQNKQPFNMPYVYLEEESKDDLYYITICKNRDIYIEPAYSTDGVLKYIYANYFFIEKSCKCSLLKNLNNNPDHTRIFGIETDLDGENTKEN